MFGGLSASELDLIRPYLQSGNYPKGSAILRQGNENSTVYFIVEGKVAIQKATEDETQKVRHITTLAEGDSFGEMELIDVQPCAASVVCLTDTQTISLSNHALYLLSQSHLSVFTRIIMNLARDISRRLRSTDNLLAMMAKSNTIE